MQKRNDQEKISDLEVEMKMNDAKLAETVNFVKEMKIVILTE